MKCCLDLYYPGQMLRFSHLLFFTLAIASEIFRDCLYCIQHIRRSIYSTERFSAGYFLLLKAQKALVPATTKKVQHLSFLLSERYSSELEARIDLFQPLNFADIIFRTSNGLVLDYNASKPEYLSNKGNEDLMYSFPVEFDYLFAKSPVKDYSQGL